MAPSICQLMKQNARRRLLYTAKTSYKYQHTGMVTDMGHKHIKMVKENG